MKGSLCLAVVFALSVPLAAEAARTRSCFEEANENGPFTYFQAERLCQGAVDANPARCGKMAYGFFTTDYAVKVCARATSIQPALCARRAGRSTFTAKQIAFFCNQATSVAPADCALAAARGIFSGDQITNLCFGAVDTYPASCAHSEFSRTRRAADAVNFCRAVQSGGFSPGPAPRPRPDPGPGPGPRPDPRPGPGGGGTGTFTTCIMTTNTGAYQGIGFTEGQATAAAREQCLQVESVLACNQGRVSCR